MDKVAIIGAGFYGLMLGKMLSKKYQVDIFEEQDDVMTKASSQCQMRIHTGMMYPKNLKTALMCVKTFKPFMLKFKDAIVDDFKSIYAVAKDSKTTSEEFIAIQKELGLPIKKIKNEFFDNVESVFECNEFTFDLNVIKNLLIKQNIIFNKHISSLDELKGYSKIFICAYSGIPELLNNFNLPKIEGFKTYQTEKIYYKDNLDRTAICVVDGNYFTTMCLPNEELKTLTATDLTTGNDFTNKDKVFERVKKFIPDIQLEYSHSTFCPKSVIDNQREVFIRRDKNIYTILGGKITNVFSIINIINNIED